MNATSADARPAPAPDSTQATSEAPSGRGGVVLAVAMGLGNLLSYVFVLILTRALGPAGFGAYSALITLGIVLVIPCLLYTSPSPRDQRGSRMPSSA